MSSSAARIGLGTAQFGMPYGATNRRGRVPEEEVRRILDAAHAAGLNVLDTAVAYGEAESVLGAVADAAAGFRIITKTVPLPSGERVEMADIARVQKGIERSRAALRRPRLDGLLIHQTREALRPGGERLVEALLQAKAQGLVERIGISLYHPDEVDCVLERFTPDLVQLPLNLLDQRFAARGTLRHLKDLGVEIHARSLFLQGTLLVPPGSLPQKLQAKRAPFESVARFAAAHGFTPLVACLGYGLSWPELDCIVVGVTGADELAAILAALPADGAAFPDASQLAIEDVSVIMPGRW